MNIEPMRPSVKNPPEQFAGDAWVDLIAAPHTAAQHAMLVKVRLGNVLEVRPGQTLYTPPGEEPWHAAPADRFMEHLALLETGEDPATTTVWGEHITNEEYHRR